MEQEQGSRRSPKYQTDGPGCYGGCTEFGSEEYEKDEIVACRLFSKTGSGCPHPHAKSSCEQKANSVDDDQKRRGDALVFSQAGHGVSGCDQGKYEKIG